MKYLSIIIALFLTQISFSQNLKKEDISGIWLVKETKLNMPDIKNAEQDKVDMLKNSFNGAKFFIGKNHAFKIEMSPNASEPFNDAMFAKLHIWRLKSPNIIEIGNNIMHLEVLKENDSYYFSLENKIVLMVERISKKANLKNYKAKNTRPNNEIDETLPQGELITEEINDVVPFEIVDKIPITKDCKPKLSPEKLKKCVSTSLMKHVQYKFNTVLASELGLSGRQKIVSKFIINNQGKVVNITSEAPHPELAKEAIRVISLIPDLTPAKHKGMPVAVEYSFPIIFQVQD